jgi:hypothetical protein
MNERAHVAEYTRLAEDAGRKRNWKRRSPYLPERQVSAKGGESTRETE